MEVRFLEHSYKIFFLYKGALACSSGTLLIISGYAISQETFSSFQSIIVQNSHVLCTVKGFVATDHTGLIVHMYCYRHYYKKPEQQNIVAVHESKIVRK